MQPQSALERADGAVELNSIAGVHADLPAVVGPAHPELDLTFRIDQPLEQGDAAHGRLVTVHDHPQRVQYLPHSLVELRLGRILPDHLGNHFIDV